MSLCGRVNILIFNSLIISDWTKNVMSGVWDGYNFWVGKGIPQSLSSLLIGLVSLTFSRTLRSAQALPVRLCYIDTSIEGWIFINPWLFDKIGVSVDKKASQISYSSFLGTDKTSITLKRLLDVILRKDLNRCCLSLEYVYLISKFHTLFDTLLKKWKTKTHHHLLKVFLQSTGRVECNSVLARHLDHHGHRHGGRGDDEHDQAAVRLGVADCGLVSGSFSVLLPVPPTRHPSILQKYNYKRLLLHLLPSLYNSR